MMPPPELTVIPPPAEVFRQLVSVTRTQERLKKLLKIALEEQGEREEADPAALITSPPTAQERPHAPDC